MNEKETPETVSIRLVKRLEECVTNEEAEQIRDQVAQLVQNTLDIVVSIDKEDYFFRIPTEFQSEVISAFRKKGFTVMLNERTVYPRCIEPGSLFAF